MCIILGSPTVPQNVWSHLVLYWASHQTGLRVALSLTGSIQNVSSSFWANGNVTSSAPRLQRFAFMPSISVPLIGQFFVDRSLQHLASCLFNFHRALHYSLNNIYMLRTPHLYLAASAGILLGINYGACVLWPNKFSPSTVKYHLLIILNDKQGLLS